MSSAEEKKIIKTLEEDDEFEDFPEDSQWTAQPNSALNAANLWDEDWDDEDGNDDFTEKLKEELKKAQKRHIPSSDHMKILDKIIHNYFKNEYAVLSSLLGADFILTATGYPSLSVKISDKVRQRAEAELARGAGGNNE